MREYYGYALVAGISYSEARRMYPGFVRDMYAIRVKYDVRMAGGKMKKRIGL